MALAPLGALRLLSLGMAPKIGIGISDFRLLRQRGLLFVDKSYLISQVLDSAA